MNSETAVDDRHTIGLRPHLAGAGRVVAPRILSNEVLDARVRIGRGRDGLIEIFQRNPLAPAVSALESRAMREVLSLLRIVPGLKALLRGELVTAQLEAHPQFFL